MVFLSSIINLFHGQHEKDIFFHVVNFTQVIEIMAIFYKIMKGSFIFQGKYDTGIDW